jgi:YggT family protein
MQLNVVNPYQPTVRAIAQMLHAVTEPLLRPIRNLLPRTGGIDFSPFVLLLACLFVQTVLLPNIAKAF